MKQEKRSPRQIADQFLEKLAEPVLDQQSELSASNVLERLRIEDTRVVSFPKTAVVPQPISPVWGKIAACFVVILAGGLVQVLVQKTAVAETVAKPVSGEIHAVGKSAAFSKYSRIEEGRVVKAGSAGGAVALVDGSQVQMSPDAVLSVVRDTDGLRVRLDSGIVLVTAASQRKGNLYVETKDCVVSVRGTVFAVSAEEGGSRVSVLEGEVQMQSGEISRTLQAGQQASTSGELRPLPASKAQDGAVPNGLARLQQPATPAPQPLPTAVGTIRGVVKLRSGVGIPDVSVTLCPNVVPAERRSDGVAFDDIVYVDGSTKDGNSFNINGFLFAGLKLNNVGCSSPNVLTDAMGRFEFSNVSPGDYTVRAEREGFSSLTANSGEVGLVRYFAESSAHSGFSIRPLPGSSLRVVSLQQTSQDISLTLIRTGVIAGRVRDGEGRLLVNAPVRVFVVSAQAPAGQALVATTITNDLGEYRAYWLLPGEYRVVSAANGRPASETWFPRAATAAEGSTVTVSEGEEVPSIDIVLRPGSVDTPPGQFGAHAVRR